MASGNPGAVHIQVATARDAAGSKTVLYGPAPKWLAPAPEPVARDKPVDGPAEVVYSDVQAHLENGRAVLHSSTRIRLLKPEALQLGNMSLVWNPSTTTTTVNKVEVWRDGRKIDVLDENRFAIFQREGRLEQAMLDGLLTANLQIPGLRVGDEIEYAWTQVEDNSAFDRNHFGGLMLPHVLLPGTFRLRLDWDEGQRTHWQPSRDIRDAIREGERSVSLVLRDPTPFNAPAEAPARYSIARLLEYSDFTAWPQVSQDLERLYAKAAQTSPGSPLKAEVERISAAYPDPHRRALAALELVQDSIRYVYTGMDGGNYTPASADETWDRRFGDCKGMTALLLALLDGLGIEAQAMMVHTNASDGMAERLPSPMLFDHVLVTTKLDGTRYWLDGTRQGEHRLLTDTEAGYRSGLPLSSRGEGLETLRYQAPQLPSELDYYDIDPSAGIKQDAKVTYTRVLRGMDAQTARIAFTSQPEETTRSQLRQSMSGGWVTPEDISWSYDAADGTFVTLIKGTGDIDWDIDEVDDTITAASTYLAGGGFYPPAERKRPPEQLQDAPFANTAGRFSCSVTRLKLPAMPDAHWTVTSRSMNRLIGGISFYRSTNLEDGIVKLIRSSRTIRDEIEIAEAEKANGKIDGFDNNKSWVAMEAGKGPSREIADPDMPDFDDVDWRAAPAPCRAPEPMED